jgi:hypothetical protein
MSAELWIGLATIVATLLIGLAKLVLPRINKMASQPPPIHRGPELTPSPVDTRAADATGPFLASYAELPATPPLWAQGMLDAIKGQEALTAGLARQLGAGELLATKDDLEDLRDSISSTLEPISTLARANDTAIRKHEIKLALLHERTKH